MAVVYSSVGHVTVVTESQLHAELSKSQTCFSLLCAIAKEAAILYTSEKIGL